MQYWWVNQNQTYDQEIKGGYMWSPKANINGGRNQFYENMKHVEPGDIVFSFRKQAINQIGSTVERAISVPKPEEFGSAGAYWANEGWLVTVEWTPLPEPLFPRQIFEEIRPHLPEKYSPLQKESGKGLQGVYLAYVPKPMAIVILRHIGDVSLPTSADVALLQMSGNRIADALEQIIMDALELDASISQTEKMELRKSRRGQGLFRKNVEAIERGCRITGVTDSRLLIASHIKPWRVCENNQERLDGNNGLLLTPTFDVLFDKGYITFDEDGSVMVSDRIERQELVRCHLPLDNGYSVGNFSDEQQCYLDYQRKSVFLG